MKKYKCKCCGYYTLEDEPLDPNLHPGTFEICPVCFWEDDAIQYKNPDYAGGANNVSLNQAKKNFELFGAVEKRLIKYVRKPQADEICE